VSTHLPASYRRAHQQPAWRRIFDGARRAFVDYQASRTLNPGASSPLAFHQAFVWGSAATFVMDLSSQRAVDGREARVYGDDQLASLTAFLREQRARPVVFLVLSVPLVYLPDWVVALDERLSRQHKLFATRWNSAPNQGARSAAQRLAGPPAHRPRPDARALIARRAPGRGRGVAVARRRAPISIRLKPHDQYQPDTCAERLAAMTDGRDNRKGHSAAQGEKRREILKMINL
jgi:hypothetical protein